MWSTNKPETIAESMGLGKRWPTYIWCRAATPLVYSLYYRTGGLVYYEVRDDYSVVFNEMSGAYYTASGTPPGDCAQSIDTLCAAGRCVW